MNNKLSIYLFFNQQYKHLNKNHLLMQYQKDLNNKDIIKNNKDFKDKYPYFNFEFYDKVNNLNLKNEKKIILHWLNYGIYNYLISSKHDFYKIYDFDYIYYKNTYQLEEESSELDCIIHYCTIGKYKNYKINKIPIKYRNKINESIIHEQKIINNYINNEIVKYENKNNIQLIKSIHHLFVHLFKCGGGEVYIKNFINYYSYIQHNIYLNSNYNNYIDEEIKNKCKIIYYVSNNDLINKLIENSTNNNIIIDHQYYLFDDFHITKKLNENENLTFIKINFIHSVDYYQKNISNINEINNYNIHLYNDKTMTLIWNNVIKPINYLGINPINYENAQNIIKKLKLIIKNEKCQIKNIAIIGRIDNHKVNLNFIDALLLYIKTNNQIFNIYGNIEENYKKSFIKKIKSQNQNQNQNQIKFHGFIEYNNINNVYLTNDLVLSPSKSEAGGTILLEAMNYGVPLIARNNGGNQETLINNKYLIINNSNSKISFETECKYFETLKNIEQFNYQHILYDILQAKKKILKKHNNQNHYEKLLKQISIFQLHDNHQQQKSIPNIVHYIYGLKEQTEEFPFLFYYGILSNILINQPTKIYFHYQHIPYGYWWNKIKKYVTLNYVNYEDLMFNDIKVKHYAHKSDYLRLLILYHYGGIYYDIDTLCVKSHKELLNSEEELILGIQEKYKNKVDLFGNAVIISKRKSKFIELLLINYEKYFTNNEWTKASLFMPSELYHKLNIQEQSNIKIVSKEYFYYPNYNETYLTYELVSQTIHPNLITFHYCNHSSQKYIEYINYNNYISYIKNDNLFGKLMKNILNIYLNQVNKVNEINEINEFVDQENIENKIYILNLSNTKINTSVSASTSASTNNSIKKQIEEIIKIENNYLLLNNIYICIYIHQSNNNLIDENIKKLMIEYSYLKNINIFIFELFEEFNEITNDLLALFFIHSNSINEIIKYKIINKNQEKIINISNEYFNNDSILNHLLNIFYIKSLKIL